MELSLENLKSDNSLTKTENIGEYLKKIKRKKIRGCEIMPGLLPQRSKKLATRGEGLEKGEFFFFCPPNFTILWRYKNMN